MTTVRNLAFAASACALAVGLTGCGRSDYAPVSGVVTLNGKPYRNAAVLFLPISTADHPTPGRGSSGHTDENGRFTLKSVEGVMGAAVGKHNVQIRTTYSAQFKGYEVWDPESSKVVKASVDPIPLEWNTLSKKEFEVPPGGTDKANFDIVTTKAPRR
jgi:hypothetical protein